MIKSLTSLRGIFILFIFFHHAGIYPAGGSMGVAFFFVLSGFCMTLGYKDRVNSSFDYKQYITKRSIKYFPLHWITLILDIPLVLMGTLHWWLIPVFFINASLLHSLIPIYDVYFSYNAVSWFLSDIFVFSLIFPFALKFIDKLSNKSKTIFASLLGAIYLAIVLLLPSNYHHAILYISPFIRMFDIVFGIYLALFYICIREKGQIRENNRSLNLLFLGILIIALIAESYFLDKGMRLIAPLYWPLIAIIILFASFTDPFGTPKFSFKFLTLLGESSFTIFLVHRLVLRYPQRLLPINNILLFVLCSLVVTIVLSLLIDRRILNPITQWLTKKIQPSMTARS